MAVNFGIMPDMSAMMMFDDEEDDGTQLKPPTPPVRLMIQGLANAADCVLFSTGATASGPHSSASVAGAARLLRLMLIEGGNGASQLALRAKVPSCADGGSRGAVLVTQMEEGRLLKIPVNDEGGLSSKMETATFEPEASSAARRGGDGGGGLPFVGLHGLAPSARRGKAWITLQAAPRAEEGHIAAPEPPQKGALLAPLRAA